MLSPAVPVIGSKVTVVGSKVTEMLKRKLQQRLMAEKAKKVKTSTSDDEKELVLPSGSDAKTICNVNSDYKTSAVGTNENISVTASCQSSSANIDTYINPISFSPQNGQNQNGFPKTLESSKNRVTKPKSSKSKRTQKSASIRCTSATNCVSVNTNTNVKTVLVAGTSNMGASSTNTVNCNFNSKLEDIKRNCATIMFNGSNIKPQQQIGNLNTLANGNYHLHSKLCRSSVSLNGEEGNTKLHTDVFGDNCIGNRVIRSCSLDTDTRDGNGEMLEPILRNSVIGDYCDHRNPVNNAEKVSPGIDEKIEILKEGASADEGNAFQKFHNPDFSSKKSMKNEQGNSGLIDSSLWPLLYGENSKQLDDYIHRIYCRDCQKSQERLPLGAKAEGENYQPENVISAHSDVKNCPLQPQKDVDESIVYHPGSLRLECESATEVKRSNEVQTSQKKTVPSVVQAKDQKAFNAFQEQNSQQLHNAYENANGSSPESTVNSPNVTSTPDRITEKDADTSATKSLTTGNAGTHSVGDTRSMKARKLSSKSAPKPSNKVIKFHEYKGPPNTSRPACSVALPPPPAVHSPPLKDDLFQKLQQRQLCLKMQLQLEFRNHQLMANLAGRRSCDLGSLGPLRLNNHSGALSVVDVAGKGPVGQPALARVSFSPTGTSVLLQSTPSLMTNPFKFVSSVNEMSQNLTTISMSLSLPLTTGSHCTTSSLLSTCETPGTPSATPAWKGDQSWNTRLVQSDMSKFPAVATKSDNESIRTGTSQNNLIIMSSNTTNSIQSVCEASTVQSTIYTIASAMTSAPILCAGGKFFPSSISSVTSNASKTKNSPSCCPSAANRANAVVIPSRLEDVKVADLKAECRKRKLVVTGPKPNLIDRLRPYEEDVLKCLSININAAVQNSEFLNTENNPPAVTGDQTSSPSSLTSMDSVVNMQPICPLHEDESNGGVSSATTDGSFHVARLGFSSEMDFTASNTFKNGSHSGFQVPPNLGLSSAITSAAAASIKPCFSCSAPAQFTMNALARNVRIPSSTDTVHLPTSVGTEMPRENWTVKPEQMHSSRPSVSFALPSVSQWYRLPQPLNPASIPVSESSPPTLPATLLSPTLPVDTPTTSFSSITSIQVPNYVVNGTSAVVIPPLSSYMAARSVGFGVQLRPSLASSQPRFSLLGLGQGKAGNIVPSCSTQSLPTGINSEIVIKDGQLLSAPNDPTCIWLDCNRAKVHASPCLQLSRFTHPQSLSSSDLLNWQQQQIQELQKQLHLSRLQLLETHRRAFEQREQFQANVPVSRASCSDSLDSAKQSSVVISDSNKTLDRNAACGHMGFDYSNTLPNIPKLNESACCDVMQELFEDYNMGVSPVNGCMKFLDSDLNGSNAEELGAFGDSCNDLLAEGMGECKAEGVDHLANNFLSPGYDTKNHSMFEMCAMEMNVKTGEANSKESKVDVTLQSEPEKLDSESFYIQVPLKEPPKYDDVIKDKQKSSLSNSVVDVTANSVDDLLQMLMKQTDVLGHSTNVTDHLLSSESNLSPPTFTSPMSHDLAIDDLTPQEMDAYPYSAGSSSSGISTAPSACGDLLNDPLSSAGISSSVFSEIPFQLPDWSDSEFLDLSLLGKFRLDQLDSKSSCKAQSTASSFPSLLNHATMNATDVPALNPMPSANDYDPCLAGFGPNYAADGLGLTDLLDVRDSSLPSSDAPNFSRSFDILDDLFMLEGDDIFQDPCSSSTDHHRLSASNISKT